MLLFPCAWTIVMHFILGPARLSAAGAKCYHAPTKQIQKTSHHVTLILAPLHWLPMKLRVEYKI